MSMGCLEILKYIFQWTFSQILAFFMCHFLVSYTNWKNKFLLLFNFLKYFYYILSASVWYHRNAILLFSFLFGRRNSKTICPYFLFRYSFIHSFILYFLNGSLSFFILTRFFYCCKNHSLLYIKKKKVFRILFFLYYSANLKINVKNIQKILEHSFCFHH